MKKKGTKQRTKKRAEKHTHLYSVSRRRKETHFLTTTTPLFFCALRNDGRDFTHSKRERKRKGETMRGGGGRRRRRLSSVFVLFVFVFVFVVVFQDASSSFVEGAKWNNNNKKEEERILWLRKWEKPCVACVRDKGVWCDNGRDDRGCVTKPNFWNTLRCARTVKCKKGCTPVRDMLDAFCKHNNNLCEKYDRAKRALIGKKK